MLVNMNPPACSMPEVVIPKLRPLDAERMVEAERAADAFVKLCGSCRPVRQARASQRPTVVEVRS